MCWWLFHKWGQWGVLGPIKTDDRTIGFVQRRTCSKCNKMQYSKEYVI